MVLGLINYNQLSVIEIAFVTSSAISFGSSTHHNLGHSFALLFRESRYQCGRGLLRALDTVGALLITSRIRFWGILYHNYNKKLNIKDPTVDRKLLRACIAFAHHLKILLFVMFAKALIGPESFSSGPRRSRSG